LVFGWFDMAEQLKDCLIVHAASIFTKTLKVNGFGSGSALWIGKSADLISSKKPHFSLDKKSSTLERTKEKQDKYNEKRSKTLCVNFMFGALASFPQDAKRPFS
jgi:hypothetical protein